MSLSDEKKPFLNHLDDLRSTLIKIIIVVGLATVISFAFTPKLLVILKLPLVTVLKSLGQTHLEKEILRTFTPTGAFTLSLKLALWTGLILASPLVLYFFSKFILPGLTEKEKKYLSPIFLWGALLLLLGISLCYWIVLPQSLRFLWKYNEMMGILPLWTLESYISFTIFLLLAFGFAFETPLVILSLVKLDVLTPVMLRNKRRHAIVAIFIIAAVLTPPDVLSQILLAIPMLLLYEGCIWASVWIKK